MDNFFAVASVAVIILWLTAKLVHSLAQSTWLQARATEVLSWRGYFIALLVISVFRIALYEMFWIPSASMQPTLREGEFVVVDKMAYGIKLPLTPTQLSKGREPERGEIVVFRFPLSPDVFYIKRIIGLPGDRLVIAGNQILLDDTPLGYLGPSGKNYIYTENSTQGLLGGLIDLVSGNKSKEVSSSILWEQLPGGWHPLLLADLERSPRLALNEEYCERSPTGAQLSCTIPDDSFFVMGDNRHRSNDSRFWGLVPRQLLVGPAVATVISLDRLSRSFSSLGLTTEAVEIDGLAPEEN